MRSVFIEKLPALDSQRISLAKRRSILGPSKKVRTKNLVSVVFLTWERDAYIEKTIQSFRKFISKLETGIDFEMISFDNGSSNIEVHKILARYKWDIQIKNPRNLGISGGLHKAFSVSNGEFVICLEDDWHTVATRSLFLPSIRIIRQFDDIGGVRHRESIQNCIKEKTEINDSQLRLEFDKNVMDNLGVRWQGKYGRRRWFDQRVTASGDKFYTWANPVKWVPSVFCNPCFLMRGEAFDRIQPMKNEAIYSHVFGNYYNAAVLVDEQKFIHMGEKRHKGHWHE